MASLPKPELKAAASEQLSEQQGRQPRGGAGACPAEAVAVQTRPMTMAPGEEGVPAEPQHST